MQRHNSAPPLRIRVARRVVQRPLQSLPQLPPQQKPVRRARLHRGQRLATRPPHRQQNAARTVDRRVPRRHHFRAGVLTYGLRDEDFIFL